MGRLIFNFKYGLDPGSTHQNCEISVPSLADGYESPTTPATPSGRTDEHSSEREYVVRTKKMRIRLRNDM